ncbi:hypothetical protein QY96_02950 [Bacillus thermotolerans]|uniref:Uncharacterized protein n=1 Tax=Bacillus thermotolerans TaxID=1221996 RepID=A0A0F5I8J4_BACTR|nr:hypothetical protein QY95_00565 [Bacillus thermotolerans]KKB44350.1 hypothetical protein QY96_02950 [Bacillus thermotolerans]
MTKDNLLSDRAEQAPGFFAVLPLRSKAADRTMKVNIGR